ncbi:MAG: tetratricopeptide repeat protein [Burkholderiales bacterium]|nr:tetratricopeptide repeat protein [Burkholderiales bacterium]
MSNNQVPNELPDHVYEEITALCKRGDELVNTGNHAEGRQLYVDALRLLPADHVNWNAATWIYVALGDSHFLEGSFEKSLRCFVNAVQCPEGLGNPFIHLRLGQSCFELGDLDKAADELTRAYMGAGLDIFLQDDPKYLDYLKTRIEI